jgi:hypothetical protein
MTTTEQTKVCTPSMPVLSVQPGDEYCGQACKEAGSSEVEIACQCDHGACPLTA